MPPNRCGATDTPVPSGDFVGDLCCDRIVHDCHAARPRRALRLVPLRRDHHLVARFDVLPVHAGEDRSGIPALSGASGAPVLRIPTCSAAGSSDQTRPEGGASCGNLSMGVASHLGIDLNEYDSRIRTFIPHYEEMLDVAAAAIPPRARTIVDLGVGTGALSARCLATARQAPGGRHRRRPRDPGAGEAPARRPRRRSPPDRFFATPLPRVRRGRRVLRAASRPHARGQARRSTGGFAPRCDPAACSSASTRQPAATPAVRRAQFDEWLAHLRQTYSAARAKAIFTSWSHEDVYVPLDAEIALLRSAGFRVELLWRRGAFAVIRARPFISD